jgi:hypothetical protein
VIKSDTFLERERGRTYKMFLNTRHNIQGSRDIATFICNLKGQSHKKVGEMRVEGDGLGPN